MYFAPLDHQAQPFASGTAIMAIKSNGDQKQA
jgi:hypothetical protein